MHAGPTTPMQTPVPPPPQSESSSTETIPDVTMNHASVDDRVHAVADRRHLIDSIKHIENEIDADIADMRQARAARLHAVAVEEKRISAHISNEDVSRVRAKIEHAATEPMKTKPEPSTHLAPHDSKHSFDASEYGSILDARMDAVSDRHASITALESRERAMDSELIDLRQTLADQRRRESIETKRESAHKLSVTDIVDAQTRKAVAECLDQAKAESDKHRIELKSELAQALRHDRLQGVIEKQSALRHESA